jgi:pyroglutamyl-peptidase
MKLLLTGFEPFGGSHINPSEQVVLALAHDGIAGVELRAGILPVDRTRSQAKAIELIAQFQPDAIVCLGEAGRRHALSIERVGINLMDYRIADNSGNLVADEPIVRGGPAAYFTTLPVRAMLAAVLQAGVPAELSLSAGAFLCNQVTYAVLDYLTVLNLPTPAGFIHLPSLPEQAARRDPLIPSMALETMVKGVRAAIGAIRATLQESAKPTASRKDAKTQI